jgi:hypothetical protein
MPHEVHIPQEWRSHVVAILRSGDERRILFTVEGRNLWQARFPDAYPSFELWDALIACLSDEAITGIPIPDMAEGYDTWEFFFTQDAVKLYGKVGLHPNGVRIKIYSAHPPRKGDTL